MSSDEELIMIDKSPFLPAESDIERVIERIVKEAKEVGRAPCDVKLIECVEVTSLGTIN